MNGIADSRNAKEEKGYYTVRIDDLRIAVHRGVLSPEFSKSGLFAVKGWDVGENMTVLDMGCGSGIIAAFAAKIQGTKVVASDVSVESVMCTKLTAALNHLQIDAIHSDLFEKIPREYAFDRIVFNHPYWDKKHDPSEPLSIATSDPEYGILRNFLNDAGGYLREDGKIILTFSSMGNHDLHRKCIDDSSFCIEKVVTETDDGVRRFLYYLVRH